MWGGNVYGIYGIETMKRTKAKGYIFSPYAVTTFMHLRFELNLNSEVLHNPSIGDLYELERFIKDCELEVYADCDGFSRELVLDGKVVWSKGLAHRDILFHAKALRTLNQEHDGKLQMVWYNK